jgi:hypothetical protein
VQATIDEPVEYSRLGGYILAMPMLCLSLVSLKIWCAVGLVIQEVYFTLEYIFDLEGCGGHMGFSLSVVFHS